MPGAGVRSPGGSAVIFEKARQPLLLYPRLPPLPTDLYGLGLVDSADLRIASST
jgi:hypothetical protein